MFAGIFQYNVPLVLPCADEPVDCVPSGATCTNPLSYCDPPLVSI